MENELTRKKPLDQNALKIIAIVAMTIDHIAWAVFPGYSTEPLAIVMHVIGRLTCPIMCYCIAEGYHYTRNVDKYTLRLLLFALVSHVPYMLQSMAFKEYGVLCFIPLATGEGIGRFLNQTSVIWSLAIGLVMLRVSDSEKIKPWLKPIIVLLLCALAFPADWSCIASLCILSIGSNRGEPKKQLVWCLFWVLMYVAVYFFAMSKVYALVQLCVFLSVPLICLYNGKRGKNPTVNKVMKWAFYLYYPLHLAVIGVLFYVL